MYNFDTIFPVQSEYFKTIKDNQTLVINAHSVKFQNDGNTTVKIKGLEPLKPNDFFIIGHYADFRAFVSDRYEIYFDTEGVQNSSNLLRVYIELVKGFPYPK